MRLVVDANILFSALIKESMTKRILFNLFYELYSPIFVFKEFKKYKEEILSKTHRRKEEFYEVLENLKEVISFIPEEEFEDYFEEAEKICPDPNDAIYFALALKLNCGIWSNDKKLKEQNKINVYSTEDLVKGFEE